MVKQRGIWTITDEGRSALERFPDPEELFREVGRLYREWYGKRPDPAPDLIDDATPSAGSVLEEAQETARTGIKDHLMAIRPYEFQGLVAGLLEAMSYHVQWDAPPGPDQGIDIVASADPLGASSPRLKVQVKRRADATNVDGLRAFLAVLGDDDIGIFVSAGGFTKAGEREARTQERRRITLVDLERFVELWVEHYEKISEEAQQLFPLRPVHYLAPSA